MKSGIKHVIVLTSNDRIYQWGKFKMGFGPQWKTVEPQFVSPNSFCNRRVLQVACGQAYTLALTQDGQIYSWGFNQCGQLGNGSRSSELEPVKITGSNGFDKKFVSVACSACVSFAVDIKGHVSLKSGLELERIFHFSHVC